MVVRRRGATRRRWPAGGRCPPATAGRLTRVSAR